MLLDDALALVLLEAGVLVFGAAGFGAAFRPGRAELAWSAVICAFGADSDTDGASEAPLLAEDFVLVAMPIPNAAANAITNAAISIIRRLLTSAPIGRPPTPSSP